MKMLQRLEVLSGCLFCLSMAAYMYFIDAPLEKRVAERTGVLDWNYWDAPFPFILALLSLVILLCSFLHAFKHSYVALGIILVLGGLIILGLFMGLVIGTAFEGHIWLGLSPGIFAFTTIVFAGANAVAYLQHKQNMSRM